MALMVVVLLGAALVALAAGGRWRRLSRLRLRWAALVPAALVAQGVGGFLAGYGGTRSAYPAGLVVSAVLAAVFCTRNIGVAGIGLVALGLAGNAVVVAANGAMPVSLDAAYRARVPIAAVADGDDPRHDLAGIGTRLRPLGDVIPVPLPVRPEVVSPGDVLVVAGLAELLVVGMMGSRRWQRRDPRREIPDGEEGAQASGT